MPDGDVFRIGEVARRTGIAASALRYYEELGVVASAGRGGGARLFRSDIFERLAAIDLFRQAGFTLAEIVELLAVEDHGPAHVHALAAGKLEALRRHIDELGQAAVILDHILRCPVEPYDACPSYRALIATHAVAIAEDATCQNPIRMSAVRAGLP